MRKYNNKGFTLVELLVVIAIIGLLASVIYAAVNQAMIKANDSKRKSHLDQFRMNMERHLSGGGSAYNTDDWIEKRPASGHTYTADYFITEDGYYPGEIPSDPNYGGRHGWSSTDNRTGYMHSGDASTESYCFYARLEIPPKPSNIHYCAPTFTHGGAHYCSITTSGTNCSGNNCDMNYKVCSNDN